jgi:bifunctional non-homologous end joining protein LigD
MLYVLLRRGIEFTNSIPCSTHPRNALGEPFHNTGWVYEEKYDVVRLLAYNEGESVRLLSRNAKDRTNGFPEIAAAVKKIRPAMLLLDGEVVTFDWKGISRFQLLQQGSGDPIYVVFDCLYADGKDLRREPLSTRRKILGNVLRRIRVLMLSRRLAENGLAAYKSRQAEDSKGLWQRTFPRTTLRNGRDFG